MQIILKKLCLKNFKGIRSLEVNFSPVTTISGDNATGKTTIFDAFIWLMFGKDSEDRKDFNIKTLDKNNSPIHFLEHEVTGVLTIDGTDHELKKIYKEKWVKKRRQEDQEFSGHTTDYFINQVPVQQKDYQAQLSSWVPEDIFKMITSVTYFNTIAWSARRTLLMKMIDDVTDQDVLSSHKELQSLFDKLSGKSFAAYKDEINYKKKRLKEDIEKIPTRIDEINNNMPQQVDEATITARVDEIKNKLSEIDSEIANRGKANEKYIDQHDRVKNEIMALQDKLREITTGLNEKRSAVLTDSRNKKTELSAKIDSLTTRLGISNNTRDGLSVQITQITKEMDELREHWAEENATALIMDESKFSCPTCGRTYDSENIESRKQEMIINFNTRKVKKLEEITTHGTKLKNQRADYMKSIEALDNEIAGITKEIEENKGLIDGIKEPQLLPLDEVLSRDPEYQEITKQIETLKTSVSVIPQVNISDLQAEKSTLNSEMDILKSKLLRSSDIDKLRARIKELTAQEKEMSQQLANLEKDEFEIQQFETAKITLLEDRINKLFHLVKFKMFNRLINGGYDDTCEAMVNGVPYSDLNHAAKINAGIDIINTLSDHFKAFAPVWIDNAEAVNELIPCKSQTVRLIVTEAKELVIENL